MDLVLKKAMFKRKFAVKQEPGLKRQTVEADHAEKETKGFAPPSDNLEVSEETGVASATLESIPHRGHDTDSEDDSDKSPERDAIEGDSADDTTGSEIEDEAEESFEAGIILSVDVQDFMCHKRFTISFGRLFNFVTGLNGAGMLLIQLSSSAVVK